MKRKSFLRSLSPELLLFRILFAPAVAKGWRKTLADWVLDGGRGFGKDDNSCFAIVLGDKGSNSFALLLLIDFLEFATDFGDEGNFLAKTEDLRGDGALLVGAEVGDGAEDGDVNVRGAMHKDCCGCSRCL